MFETIRKRLTILYTLLMMSFLLVFAAVAFFSVASLIFHQQKQDLMALVQRAMVLPRDRIYIESGERGRTEVEVDPTVNGFYFLIDMEGQVLGGREFSSSSRSAILEKLHNWKPKLGDVGLEYIPLREGKKIPFLVTRQVVFRHSVPVGWALAGKNVEEPYHDLRVMLTVFGGLSLLFLAIASWAGYYMAGRAMEPIHRSFQRQKEFVADASHELRTPLSVLQASLEVLEGEDDNRLTEFSRQVVTDMKDEVGRMSRLVGALLTLARADSGVLQVIHGSFDLRPEAERLIRTLQTVAAKAGITLELQGPPSFPLFADKERIVQLLSILLDNGIKYTPAQGKVSLELSYTGSGKERQACLTVRDTGVGIPPEEQSRIFDRFYRVDKERSRAMGGTGLGLAIARWIVDAHGGKIRLESAVGKGSVFTVILPAGEG